MPFVEIKKRDENWGNITSYGISLPKKLWTQFSNNVKVYLDEEKKLVGLENAEDGYKLTQGMISVKKMPSNIYGKFYAEWDSKYNMIIIDLSQPLK